MAGERGKNPLQQPCYLFETKYTFSDTNESYRSLTADYNPLGHMITSDHERSSVRDMV